MTLATLISNIASDRSILYRQHAVDRLSLVANRWLEHAAHYDDCQRSHVITAYNVCALIQDARKPGCSREWLNKASRWVLAAQESLRNNTPCNHVD